MSRSRAAAARTMLLLLLPAVQSLLLGQYVGSKVCRGCHAGKFESQSKTGHAGALAVAPPGSAGYWAFGAGEKATTWVTQRDEDTIAEHGLSYYSSIKAKGLTPGHANADDVIYRNFDPVGTALRCFRCHSTGPVKLSAGYRIEPSEPGVRCEACHGPGAKHASAKGAPGSILNPKRLSATALNELCGACHRQASELDDETDWDNAWNVRHQPSYLHRAACFRNSNGALSCLTCHNPHEPLRKETAYYDSRCASCHRNVVHKTALGSRACIDCHMPQVVTSPALRFTNHWIGVDEKGNTLVPARRVVRTLKASPASPLTASPVAIASDPSTLTSVYEAALIQREKELGPTHARVARAASDLGLFLMQIHKPAEAEKPLRRAVEIDRANADAMLPFDLESLGSALEAGGKQDEAFPLFREAAARSDARVAARSFASMARLDPAHADSYLRNAIQAEESASGKEDRRVAALLHELALALRERNDDRSAEPLLRRALDIQEKLPKPDYHLTVGIMNTLGNLLEGARRMDEAEHLEREALRISEQKFGPESQDLAMTCTNLADILWNRKQFGAAAQLYRRAMSADTALYGPDRPETAADIANLGMLLKDAGQAATANSLLRQALTIYEKTLGPDSAQAKFVRQNLSNPVH
ncbi:MAG TPA: tetratricopeptide repeat protein [Bryobacteraceae bacterium]|nr:tetratricopeptide repeat protein [Bryobacteraceae bacterium]